MPFHESETPSLCFWCLGFVPPLFSCSASQGAGEEDGWEENRVVDVVPGVATDISGSKDGDEGQEEEEAFVKDLERERAGTTFSKAKELEEKEAGSDSSDSSDDNDDDDEEEEGGESGSGSDDEEEGSEAAAPASAVEEEQTEEQEHHEMSRVSDE